MPQPTPTDVHVDAILTSISTAYMQNQTQFIASQVFPVIPVTKQSDKYYTYPKGDWFRDEAQLRPPATESAGSGYSVSTDNYNCDVWAFHKDVDDQTRANTDSPLNADRDATLFVAQRMLLRREIQWVTDYFATSVWGTDNTTATDWDNYTSSDPISDIETAKAVILGRTGFLPNTLVLGYDVYRSLKHHPDIIDRFKYTSSENMTADILARLFEVGRILVPTAIRNSSPEGAAASFGFTHGKNALLCYVNPSPSLMQPSAGYHFAWNGVSDGLGTSIGTTMFRIPEKRVDRIESQMAWDNKVVGADLGYFFSAIVG